MLARTNFQHVSGTRCKLDFVETPSVLMEYFCRDYRVVKQFAKHHETGAVLPAYLLKTALEAKDFDSALETQTQVLYSVADQVFHGRNADQLSVTATFDSLQNQYLPIRAAPNTAWVTKFSHLYGYGAGYYSYLHCRMYASQIWATCFQDNPLSREAGERYRREVLAHGGGKDPQEMIMALLGGEATTTEALISELA